ncbi:MAG: copper amine oxidase N-terminal domain-containing protein, partial [Defluviitaleaceae bacterium]|nr:copper amine oxidase N-terminal domain-containing protein [Defluviitaleaceae bacterium]
MRKVKLLIAVLLLSLVVSVPAIAGTWADVPQRIFEGEAFVPLRLTAYANNAAVEWDGLAHSVNITFASGNTYIVRVDAVGGFIEDGTLWIPYEYAVRIFAVDVPVVQFESSIPLDIAADLLAETAALWDADAGELWGFHLHAPLMIADPLTRHAVTNMPDPEGNFHPMGGVYVGILPGHVFISHTITDFAGLTWGMMAWEPGMEYIITYHMDAIIRLLVHEGFHAIQFIEIVSGDWPRYADQRFEYLNFSADARITVLMEVYALAEAVRSEGDERIQAIHDALSVRAHRRALLP